MPMLRLAKNFSPWIRGLFFLAALGSIFLSFVVMQSISDPSQFVNAFRLAEKGPRHSSDLRGLPILDFRRFLYLAGPIQPASVEKRNAPLFSTQSTPVLPPSVFTDAYGAVEILATDSIPLTFGDYSAYRFNAPYHMLGWRTGDSAFRIYALANSQSELLSLLLKKAGDWKSVLFVQGLALILLVFAVFWALNLGMLSNPALGIVQLLIVNVIFLLLYYSVLIISEYPLGATLLPGLGILGLGNLVFIPLSLVFKRHSAHA